MATFQIHEDVNNVDDNHKYNITKIDLVPEMSKKRPICSRPALQTVNNVLQQDAKRVKYSDHQSNDSVRVISIQTTQAIKEEIEENEENILNLECVQLDDKNSIIATKVKTVSISNKEKDSFSLDLLHNQEYKYDIWSYLKEIEGQFEWPKPNYIKKQKHIDSGMRAVLVDWLVAVSEEYTLNEETLHLTVNYIDRFLSKMSVVRDKFQLLGSVAMMVAGKVEEIYPPDMKEWIYLSSDIYTNQQFLKMEQLLLKVLKFDVQPPTSLSFIRLLCNEHALDEETMYLAMYFSELVLLEGGEYLQHVPSKLAAASVALARLTLSKRKPWPKKFVSSSGYTFQQLIPIVEKQNVSFTDSPSKSQQTIQSKYGKSKYHKVALLKPRNLKAELFKEE